MGLNDILKKYCDVGQTNDYVVLLRKLELYPALDALVLEFNDSITRCGQPAKNTLFRKLLKKLIAISANYLKNEKHFRHSKSCTYVVFKSISSIVEDACWQCSVDIASCLEIMSRYIGRCDLLPAMRAAILCIFQSQLSSDPETGSMKKNKVDEIPPPLVPIKLEWILRESDDRYKMRIENFVYEMIDDLHGVGPEEDVVSLIREPELGLKIEVPCTLLSSLLTLLLLMNKCGRIKCTPRKGLFVFLKSMITLVAPGAIPGRENWSKWLHHKLKDYGEIVKVKNNIKEIYFAYCPTENGREVWDDFFEYKFAHAKGKPAVDGQKPAEH